MARDGSGTFDLAEAAFVNGTTIDADAVNSDLSDIAAGLTQSLSKDGQTVPTGNQPMGGFNHTGVGAATAATHYARYDQVQNGASQYALTTGDDTILATLTPAVTAYAIGQTFHLKKNGNANTGAVTLNANSVGAGAVTWPDGTALAAADLPANCMFTVTVQATTPVFHLQSVAFGDIVRKAGAQTITGAKTFSAAVTMSGAALNEAVRVDVASGTPNLGAAASNWVRITGTTTITAFDTVAAGIRRHVVFNDILILDHDNTALILPNAGSNITTAAGDTALFMSEGSGNWRCLEYTRLNGTPLASGYTPPQRAYAYVTVAAGGPATVQKQSGITSVTWTATGKFTVVMSSAMPDANYRVLVCSVTDPTVTTNAPMAFERVDAGRTTTTFYVGTLGDNVGYQDPDAISIEVFA